MHKIAIYWFNRLRPCIKVGVYGDSGVGKTQFLMTITGNNSYVIERTRRLKKFRLVLKNGRRVEFIDTPGHQSSKTVRKGLKKMMMDNRLNGIINIVNYGYQDGGELNPNEAFNVDTNAVKPSYLEENRKREIERTREFVDAVEPGIHLQWVVTLVNKADIWYNEQKTVMNYYEEDGEYWKLISNLKSTSKLFVYPFCSIITPFANRPMMLYFSEKDKTKMFDEFVDLLYELVNNYKDA